MLDIGKLLTAFSELLASVSTNLSIALVFGLAALPVINQGHAPPAVHASAATSPAPVEVIRTRSIPLPQSAAAKPLLEPDARQASPAEPREAAPADGAPLLVAARRHRRQRQDRVQREPEPVRKNSAIATEEKPKTATPVPTPDTKPESAQAEPPKPDVWTEAEIIAGLRECVRLLAPIAADIEIEEPVKHEQCGAPAPVALRRIGSGTDRIEIRPPATINCAMVASLHAWVEGTLQPAAREAFGSPIVRLRSASGYACRKRNGSTYNADKLSEHAKANAVDIAGFVTADGRTIEVGRFWGPTTRDLREAEKKAREAREDAKQEKAKPEPAKSEAGPTRKSSAIAARSRDLEKSRHDAPIPSSEPQKLGRDDREAKGDGKSAVAALAAEREAASRSVEGAFLRRLHKGACGTFGTVLGPEANEAHRDHFHFDLAPRRRSAFCE